MIHPRFTPTIAVDCLALAEDFEQRCRTRPDDLATEVVVLGHRHLGVPELKPARLYRWTLLDTARSASSDDRC